MLSERVVATPAYLLAISDEDDVSPVDGSDHHFDDRNELSELRCTPCVGASTHGVLAGISCDDLAKAKVVRDVSNHGARIVTIKIDNNSVSLKLDKSAAAVKGKKKGRRYLMDTGSGYDLESYDALTKEEKEMIRMVIKKITLWTAAGKTSVKETTTLVNSALNETINPLLLEDTPAVLTIGRRCMEYGYAFHWEPYDYPYLVTPNGHRIILEVEHYVPFLDEDGVRSADVETAHICQGVPSPVVEDVTESTEHFVAAPSPDEVPEEGGDIPAEDSTAFQRSVKEAESLEHMMLHLPKNPTCRACQISKCKNKHSRRLGNTKEHHGAEKFGDLITSDTWYSTGSRSLGQSGERYAETIYDVGTDFIYTYPSCNKNTDEAVKALSHFVGRSPAKTAKLYYADRDNALQLAAAKLGIASDKANRNRKQTNAIAERRVQQAKSGMKATLYNGGLPLAFWAHAAKHWCFSRNIYPQGPDNKSAWERRHGEPFSGLVIPFGAAVKFKPPPHMKISTPEPSCVPGIFLGYEVSVGHVWKEMYVVSPLEDFEKGREYSTPGNHIRVVTTEQIVDWSPTSVVFPCAEARRRAEHTIDKLVDDNAKTWEDIMEDGPDEGGQVETAPPVTLRDMPAIDFMTEIRLFVDTWDQQEMENCNHEDFLEHFYDFLLGKYPTLARPGEKPPQASDAGQHGILPDAPIAAPKEPPLGDKGTPKTWDAPGKPWHGKVPTEYPEVPKPSVEHSGSMRVPWIDSFTWSRKGSRWRAKILSKYKEDILAGREIPPFDYPLDKLLTVAPAVSYVHPSAPSRSSIAKSDEPVPAIVEWCCGPKSLMGLKENCGTTKVVRITENDDATSASGLYKAVKAIRENGKNTLVWISIPCTGGSRLAMINVTRPGGRDRLRQHRELFYKIWLNTVKLLEAAFAVGAKVAIEWPSSCSYWKLKRVERILALYHLKKARCNGCAMNLRGRMGKLIYKPWTVATNCDELFTALDKKKCPEHSPEEHEPCAGANTKPTEGYTTEMVAEIHNAWKRHVTAENRKKLEAPSLQVNAAASTRESPICETDSLNRGANSQLTVPHTSTRSTTEHAVTDIGKTLNETTLTHTELPSEGGIPPPPEPHKEPRKPENPDFVTTPCTLDATTAGETDGEPESDDKEWQFEADFTEFPVLDGYFTSKQDDEEYYPALPAPITYAKPYAKWDDGKRDMNLALAAGYHGDDEWADKAERLRKIRKTFPRHKLRKNPFQHRSFCRPDTLFNSLVARPVGKAELLRTVEAQQAMILEYTNLSNKGVWDLGSVEDWEVVRRDAKRRGVTAVCGNIFGLCVEKSSERKDGLRKFKGRYVYQGNWVKNENMEIALFSALSSAPATLEASKFVDAVGMQVGYDLMQADAKQAYIQAELKGSEENWVRLPKECKPKSWATDPRVMKMKDPVVRLKKALYGHPDSGGYWERHCAKALEKENWRRLTVDDSWKSCFYHPEYDCTLMVYVDDFKMAGPKGEKMRQAWASLHRAVDMDPEEKVNVCLGIGHNVKTKTLENGSTVNEIEYDMKAFFQQCVDSYCSKVPGVKLRKVASPFLSGPKHTCDDLEGDDDDPINKPGTLGKTATSVLMKVLYGARACRFDLLRAVQGLAAKVSKWSERCDQAFHKLMCYVDSTKNLTLKGHVGDKLQSCKLALYADADFASEADGKSTSGAYLELVGPNTRMPLHAKSQKQGCTAHCTPEAEIVAANMAVRTMGIPGLDFFKGLYQNDSVKLELFEDNAATEAIIKSGRNPKLRHVLRTQKVNVKWLHDVFTEHSHVLKIVTCPTKEMKADIFTKAFPVAKDWVHACSLLGLTIPPELYRGAADDIEPVGEVIGKMKKMALTAAYTSKGRTVLRRGERCCALCCPENLQIIRID